MCDGNGEGFLKGIIVSCDINIDHNSNIYNSTSPLIRWDCNGTMPCIKIISSYNMYACHNIVNTHVLILILLNVLKILKGQKIKRLFDVLKERYAAF